jgi:hypothetical protein
MRKWTLPALSCVKALSGKLCFLFKRLVMRNLIFRVLAGLLGFSSLYASFDAIINLNIMLVVYLFMGVLFLIFAFGGYKGTDWVDYYMNRAADKMADLFSKK